MTINVKICTGHFLARDDNSHEVRIDFDKLTPAEETELREIAQSQLPPRAAAPTKRAKRSRGNSGRPSRRINYAALVVGRDVAGANENKLPASYQ